MKGATERWVEMDEVVYQDCKEVCVWIFKTEREFYAGTANRDCVDDRHPTCQAVSDKVFAKTQERLAKIYRLTRMEYVGYLYPTPRPHLG